MLINTGLLESIALEVKDSSGGGLVFEFGAGTGNLTEYLLKVCRRVIAVEMERDMIKVLKERFYNVDKLDIIEMNMMDFDFEEYFSKYGRLIVVANLPYNISKLFLFKLFDNALYLKDAFLMFQFEVAERITARVGDRNWSAISVFTNMLTTSKILFKVNKGSFSPPPKVESALVWLRFLKDSKMYSLYKSSNKLVQKIFNYPRKSVKSIIKLLFGKRYLDVLSERLDLSKRPQSLTLDDIRILSEVVGENERGM